MDQKRLPSCKGVYSFDCYLAHVAHVFLTDAGVLRSPGHTHTHPVAPVINRVCLMSSFVHLWASTHFETKTVIFVASVRV